MSSEIVTRSIARKMEGETAKNVSADADHGRTHAEQQGCHDRKYRVQSYCYVCFLESAVYKSHEIDHCIPRSGSPEHSIHRRTKEVPTGSLLHPISLFVILLRPQRSHHHDLTLRVHVGTDRRQESSRIEPLTFITFKL